MSDERHERVSRLLGENGPLAPPALRQRIEAEAAAERSERRPREWPRMARFALGAAVALIALALVLPRVFDSGGGEPTVLDAHAILGEQPQAAAPAPLADRPGLLAAEFDGVRFPNWEPEFGWKPFGQRRDVLDGRRAETVYYEHEGHEIAYTIVGGKPLSPPPGAEHRRVDGVELALYRAEDGHEIVSFQRHGKTCVLSGHVEHRSTMVELATWRADGDLSF